MFHVDLDKAADQMVSLYRETKLDGVDPSDYTTEQEFFTFVSAISDCDLLSSLAFI